LLLSKFQIRNSEKKLAKEIAVFPCILTILPNCIFHQYRPIILGVHIDEGVLKRGTPICIPSQKVGCDGGFSVVALFYFT
jgi:translation initiation factor 5B